MPTATIHRDLTGRVTATTDVGTDARSVTATVSRGPTGGVTATITAAGAGE